MEGQAEVVPGDIAAGDVHLIDISTKLKMRDRLLDLIQFAGILAPKSPQL